MKVAIFITFWFTGLTPEDFKGRFEAQYLPVYKNMEEVVALDIYTPVAGPVPVMNDEGAPAVILQFTMASREEAQSFFDSHLHRGDAIKNMVHPVIIDRRELDMLEIVSVDPPAVEELAEGASKLSMMVRYYGPAADGAFFVERYVKHHPPLLAQFPRIRKVFCYLPIGWRDIGTVSSNDLLIGNEVIFDNLADLNDALKSSVMTRVREDGKQMPEYGESTHFAMDRERLFVR